MFQSMSIPISSCVFRVTTSLCRVWWKVAFIAGALFLRQSTTCCSLDPAVKVASGAIEGIRVEFCAVMCANWILVAVGQAQKQAKRHRSEMYMRLIHLGEAEPHDLSTGAHAKALGHLPVLP